MSEARFKVTYKPEGVDPKVWEIDLLDDVRASEYIAVQQVSGLRGVAGLLDGLGVMDMTAVKSLLWLLLKRSMSTIPWDGLDFTLAELEFEQVATEPADEDPKA